LFVTMSFDATKPLSESLGIAVFASGANFGAAADWVPGGVGPLDFGVIRQLTPQN
jgi:hypothetical protein